MDISILEQYVELTRTLNFTQAARRLNVAQSTLSRNIGLLEKAVGAQLLVRKCDLTLTAAGRTVLRYASDISQSYTAMLDSVKNLSSQAEGTLILLDVSGQTRAFEIIRSALDRLAANHPGIETSMILKSGKTCEESLIDQDIDIGFTWFVAADTNHSPAYQHRIKFELVSSYSNEAFVGLSKLNPLAEAETLSITDLKDLYFIRPVEVSAGIYFDSIDRVCEQHGFKPRYRFSTVQVPSERFSELPVDGVHIVVQSVLETLVQQPRILEPMAIKRVSDVDLTHQLYVCWDSENPNPNIPLFMDALLADSGLT